MLSGVSGHLRQNGDADRLILKRWALSGQCLVRSHMRSDACFRVREVVICMKEPVSSLLSIFERWVNLGDAAHIRLLLSLEEGRDAEGERAFPEVARESFSSAGVAFALCRFFGFLVGFFVTFDIFVSGYPAYYDVLFYAVVFSADCSD